MEIIRITCFIFILWPTPHLFLKLDQNDFLKIRSDVYDFDKLDPIDSIEQFGQSLLDSIYRLNGDYCCTTGKSNISIDYFIDFGRELKPDQRMDDKYPYCIASIKQIGIYCLSQKEVELLVERLRRSPKYLQMEKSFVKFYFKKMSHHSSIYSIHFKI